MKRQLKPTWHQAVARYIKTTADKKSHNSEVGHLKFLSKYIGDNTPLCKITSSTIAQLKEQRKKFNYDSTKQTTVSTTTVNRMLAVLRIVLHKAKNEWEWVDNVPYIKLDKEQPRCRWITKSEAKRLIGALPQPYSDITHIAFLTGLRQSNILNLTWDQIDFNNNTIYIESANMKSGKPHIIPLVGSVVRILNKLPKKSTRVFSRFGEPVRGIPSSVWQKALAMSNIQDFRFHDTRHTFATWFLQDGGDIFSLSRYLNHANIQMTMKYAHFSISQLRTAVDRMDTDVLDGGIDHDQATKGISHRI